MSQQINTLNNFLRLLCKPNQKLYSDLSSHEFQWSRNLMVFYMCLGFVISTTLFSIHYNFSSLFNMAFFLKQCFLLLCFTLLCRTYIWTFNVIYILISVAYEYKALDLIPEVPYIHTGFVLLALTCIIVRRGSIKLTLLSGTLHFFVYLTKFKERLVILIRNEEPEIFAEKFVKGTAFVFVLVVLTELALIKTLEQRTLELLKVRGELEKALEQQKTFIFSFSHELRNPLNSLLGNLQLVLQEDLSIKAKEMVNIAKVCGEILLHNINNVLDTGKNELGKLEISPVSTPLSEILQRTWSIYSEPLRQKKLKSRLRVDKEIPAMVKIDSHKLNQIMLNLIGNAIKFTDKGSVVMTAQWVRSHEINEKCFEPIPYDDIDEGLFEKEENLSIMTTLEEDAENERRRFRDQKESKGILKIIVKDTGSGMKKEALGKLFQKFSQVSENVSQRQIGTGLGLFITKEICLAMGGEIRAFSKFGVGTTFIACLPVTSIPEKNLPRVSSDSIVSELTKLHLRALVADDSPFNVNLIGNYFSQFGGTVVSVAYNGFDAYMKYEECKEVNGKLDVITLDIDMPILDGRKVCDSIRKYEKTFKLKPVLIILISGNYDREQVEEYLEAGRGSQRADCFLRKPVSYSDFNRAIYDLLQERSW